MVSTGLLDATAELRLPRPPGALRRFSLRHPTLSDGLVAAVALLFSLAPVTPGETFANVSPTVGWLLFAVVMLAGVALLGRRRFPLAVYAIGAATQALFLFTPLGTGLPFLFVTGYTVAVVRSNRAAWAAFAVAGAAFGLLTGLATQMGWSSPTAAVSTLVISLVFLLIGTLVGSNVGTRRRYQESLIERSRQLAVERDQQSQLAAAAERTRIARELHDIVAHSLTVMVALSEGAAATTDLARARVANDAIAAAGREALNQMRATLGVLRGEARAPLTPAGDDATLQAVEAARAVGLDATLTVVGPPTDDAQIRLAVSRIVQEAVTNAMRHARGASKLTAVVRYGPEAVEIEVADDGRPADESQLRTELRPCGFGLRGLRERASLAGGTFEAGPTSPAGWRVRATLPVPREEETPS